MVALKPNVGIDLDGVLCDFNKEFLRLSRKILGKPEKGFKVTNYNHYDQCGWTKAEVERVINWMRHTDDFWTTLDPFESIGKLRQVENKLNLFYITARFSTDGLPTSYQAEQWLRKRVGLREPYVIVNHEKGKEAVGLDLDYMLDDKTENCIDIVESLPSCQVYVLTRPGNENLESKYKSIKRVSSVNEYIEEILKNEKL